MSNLHTFTSVHQHSSDFQAQPPPFQVYRRAILVTPSLVDTHAQPSRGQTERSGSKVQWEAMKPPALSDSSAPPWNLSLYQTHGSSSLRLPAPSCCSPPGLSPPPSSHPEKAWTWNLTDPMSPCHSQGGIQKQSWTVRNPDPDGFPELSWRAEGKSTSLSHQRPFWANRVKKDPFGPPGRCPPTLTPPATGISVPSPG